MMSAKQRIQFVVKDRDLRACIDEQPVQIAMTRAIHQFHRDLHPRFPDDVEVDELAQLFEIAGLRIKGFALERANDRAGKGPVLRQKLIHVGFDLFGHVGCAGRAVAGGEFQSLILRRVVAGGHVDAANRFSRPDGVSDHRSRRVTIAEQGSESVRGQNFGGGQREFASQKSGVVTNNHDRLPLGERRARAAHLRREIIGDCLRGQPDVVEGEVTRNNAAPAGGAKFDGGHGSLKC